MTLKNQSKSNTEFNYEFIEYTPTLEDLREYYLYKKYPGYDKNNPEKGKSNDFANLIKSEQFFEYLLNEFILNRHIPNRFFGLAEVLNGQFTNITNFLEIVSYHPNEGYAFAKDKHDAIYLISLSTPHLFEEWHFNYVSGIKNRAFKGRSYYKDRIKVYYIIEELDQLHKMKFKDWEEEKKFKDELPDSNGKNFKPRHYRKGEPYYQDTSFQEAIQKNIKLRILVPDELKSNDEISEDSKNLAVLRYNHPQRDSIYASLLMETIGDIDALFDDVEDLPF